MLEEIRLKAQALYEELLLQDNAVRLNKVRLIITFLKDDNCFNKTEMGVSLLVLRELGYSRKEVKEKYKKVMLELQKNLL